ncbi:ninjurin-2-like [Planococcus citri]|uniref:ninjurin-2-like n=1 Tax=Planococcus citri TaxID=170843 RepID=UPI0031F97A63
MLAKYFQKFFKMSNSSVAPVDTLVAENEAELKKQGTININQYTTKKTVAQGMLDIALLTSNASQLKYILQTGEKMQFYHILLWLISSSIILQIVVGGLFLMIGGLNLNDKPDHKRATLLNDIILLFIFLITSVNVIISGFGLNSTVA